MRRFFTSSSSTARSEWRVTRNWENSVTWRPGNRSDRCERIRLEMETKWVCLEPLTGGMRKKRGRMRGTLTMAISFSRPKASLPVSRTMKLSDLLATCGNGCAGSSPTGNNSGCTSRTKKSFTQRRWRGLRSPWATSLMPFFSSRGNSSSL
ncbi:hypothetical protein D9M69_573640 [compost metagenome]